MDKTDIEIVMEVFRCTTERASDLIQRGVNVAYLRDKKSAIDKKMQEAQTKFMQRISEIKTDLENSLNQQK